LYSEWGKVQAAHKNPERTEGDEKFRQSQAQLQQRLQGKGVLSGYFQLLPE